MRRNECGVVGGGAAEELARRGMWCVGHVPWCVCECARRAVDCGVDDGRGACMRGVYMRSVGHVDSSFTTARAYYLLLLISVCSSLALLATQFRSSACLVAWNQFIEWCAFVSGRGARRRRWFVLDEAETRGLGHPVERVRPHELASSEKGISLLMVTIDVKMIDCGDITCAESDRNRARGVRTGSEDLGILENVDQTLHVLQRYTWYR